MLVFEPYSGGYVLPLYVGPTRSINLFAYNNVEASLRTTFENVASNLGSLVATSVAISSLSALATVEVL